ncbi:hypothetical protein NL437_26520, partial [Klebsiella pneumoniae]|nr:hypothetical protein [Klebsiella pneumoniae]
LDPDRFGAAGASAGGHLVALLGTSPTAKELDGDYKPSDVSPAVQAVCDIFGPADLVTIGREDATNAVSRLLGGTVREKKELAKLGSPVNYVT